jgi:hypothetical protein
MHVRQVGLGTPNAAAINDALSASATAAPYEPITRLPLSLLSEGNVYTFRLRVETHVGAQSSPVEASVQVGVDAPSVTINAPSSMLRSEPLVLEPTVTVCGGAATGGLSWQWSASLGGTGARAGEAVLLRYNSSRSLVVEAGTLPSGETVVFNVRATARSGGEPGVSAASIVVHPTPLVASISGGASVSRGQEDELLLDASSSYDPDAAAAATATTGAATSTAASAGVLSYAWACTASSYPNGSAAPGCIGLDGEVLVLQDATSSMAKVPKGTLRTDHSYTFRLDVTAPDRRTASAAIGVHVEPSSPPLVSLALGSTESPQPLATKVSADAILRVRGDTTAGGGRTLSYAWSVVQTSAPACSGAAAAAACTARAAEAVCACLARAESGGTCTASTAFDVTVTAASVEGLRQPNLILPTPGAVLSAGATYIFVLGATAEGGASCGFSTLSVTLNAPPSGGSLALFPASGTARNTSFALRAPGWVDEPEDLPLLYTYFYAPVGTHAAGAGARAGAGVGEPGAALPLGLSGFYAALDTSIPVAGSYEVFARVVDTQGCAALSVARNVSLSWGAPTQTSEQATALAAAIVANELERAEMLQDAAQVQAVVSSATKLLDQALAQRQQQQAAAAGGTATTLAVTRTAEAAEAAEVDAADRRTELRASLIGGLATSLGEGAASRFVYAHARLVSQVTSAPGELRGSSRLQAAQLAGALARRIRHGSGEDGGAQQSLATTLSNVLSGAELDGGGAAAAAAAAAAANTNATALVDTVEAGLGALSASLVRGAVAGETYMLRTPNLALRAARYTELVALSNLTLTTTAATGGGDGGDGDSAERVSVSLPGNNVLGDALGAVAGTVDVQLVTFGFNPRAYAAVADTLCAAGGSADAAGGDAAASDGCEVAAIGVANTTTLVLRQGEVALNVSNLSANVLLSFPVALPASLAAAAGACTPTAPAPALTAPASCTDGADAAGAVLEAEERRCEQVGKALFLADLGLGSVSAEFARCQTNVAALNVSLAAAVATCCSGAPTELDARKQAFFADAVADIAAHPRKLRIPALNASLAAAAAACAAEAPCSGHGTCLDDGRCACEDGWLGPECDTRLACRYYSEDRGVWATDGCEVVSGLPRGGTAGLVTCGCTHLTSFTTFAEQSIRQDEGGLGSITFDLSSLKLTLPFTSLSELVGALRDLGAAGWSLVAAVYVAMLAALLAMHRRDERLLQVGFMPLWHKLLAQRATTTPPPTSPPPGAAASASASAAAAAAASAASREVQVVWEAMADAESGPMLQSVCRPGIKWQGVAIDLVVLVPGQRDPNPYPRNP